MTTSGIASGTYLGENDADEFNITFLESSLGDGELGNVSPT